MNLINTIEQVRAIIGSSVRKDNTFEILKPYLEKTQTGLISQLIGADLLEEIAEPVEPGIKTKLQDLVKKAIVWNAFLESWYQALYEYSGSGIKKQDLRETSSLFRYQEEAVQKDIVKKADEAIEALMLFLEANAEQLPTYKNSAEFAQNFSYLISSPQALQISLPEISKSFRMYTVLRGFMERAERATVKSVMGSGLYDNLKSKVRSGTSLDADFKKLLLLCQEFTAPATLLEAMPWIRVQFSPSGIRIASVLNNLQDEAPISDTQTVWLMSILKDRVDQSKTALRMFLNANASNILFPEYFHSDLYRAPGSKPWIMPDNAGKKHFRL